MMEPGIQELQRSAIVRMFDLEETGESWGRAQTWKVLVYDTFCKEVVAPLLKVGGLRNNGVTLHLNLNGERLPVEDTPAVYFVEPTDDNIARIIQDLEEGLYPSCYINFASMGPRAQLEDLARGTLVAGATHRVAAVFDRYLSFVSLSPTLFSLNLPAAYRTIHSPSIEEHQIQQYIERIVDGLLSVLVTLRALPVIRCPPHEVAEMVARRLEERIHELLSKGSSAADLFSASSTAGAAAAESGQRPLLCIVDRDIDLVTMLNHTWTYQAMANDVLGMRLNRLTVPVAGDSGPPQPKVYDVDDSDAFWAAHAGDPFPDVAEAVTEAVEEFQRRREEMHASSDVGAESIGNDLAAAFSALPEMTERKRSIDMHTNIATALMKEVEARQLHQYYEIEDQFSSQSSSTSVSQLEQLLNDSGKGTILDKTRALLVLYLTKESLSSAQLQGLVEALEACGGDASGITYLQHLASIRSMMVPSTTTGSSLTGGGSSGSSSGASALFDRLRQGGEGLLAAGKSGLKNVLTSKKELAVCKILDALMDHKTSSLTENFLYLDPKGTASGARGETAPRVRAPFRRAIAFVVGGGSYAELQALQELAQKQGRHIVYGSTDLVAPCQFAEELCHLGRAQGGS